VAVNLRSFRRGDAAAVAELSRTALARPEDQVGNPVWQTREDLENELADWVPDPEETLVVAEEEEGVVGFGGIELPSGFSHAELFGPLVRPSARGHKLGTRLLDASLELAGASGGVEFVVAAVGTRNADGQMLLQRKGFGPRGKPQATFRLRPDEHRPVPDRPDGLDVRPGTPADLDEVLALYRECFPDGRFPDVAWRTSLELGEVTVAEAGGRPVAIAAVDARDRWMYHVGVSAAERERGVGAYLVSRALERHWHEHPDETIGLDVLADNVPAIRLYRRQGFAPWLVLQPYELTLGS